ncbi:MAG: hypothetical protein ACXVB9_18465 [Bdellovibrionota bacterium]
MNDLLRWAALASLAVYFIVDFFDSRRVEDERERLIQLKALELAHKVTMAALTGLAAMYAFRPGVDAQIVILTMIAVALYGEVAAKIFYRWRL